MLKKIIDILFSSIILLMTMPIVLIIMFLIWKNDFHSPIYHGKRVGKNGRVFIMYKLRSMNFDAEKTGVQSTSSKDPRITSIGHVIRKYKMDELLQFWNVLKGDMSIVGPRPNTIEETSKYSEYENLLLTVRPGITDFSSIVFSNEADILADFDDPERAYDELIRPWKSKLGVLYIQNSSFIVDIKIIFVTVLALISKKKAMVAIEKIIELIATNRDIIDFVKTRDIHPTSK